MVPFVDVWHSCERVPKAVFIHWKYIQKTMIIHLFLSMSVVFFFWPTVQPNDVVTGGLCPANINGNIPAVQFRIIRNSYVRLLSSQFGVICRIELSKLLAHSGLHYESKLQMRFCRLIDRSNRCSIIV